MVSKKILAVAIAAAFSSQAFAVINLNDKDDAGSKIAFAKEALLTTQKVTGNDSGTYYKVTDAGAAGIIDVKVKLGTGLANTQKRFIRLELTNAVFTGASALSAVVDDTSATLPSTATASTAVVVQGGADKDVYAILELTADGAITQDNIATINVAELGINAALAVGFKASVYETLTAAVNQTANTSLNTKELTSVITTASGVKVSADNNTVTASVDKSFKEFVTSVDYANLGKLVVSANTDTKGRTGATVTLADVIVEASSKVKLLGDFSVGTFAIGTAAATTNATAKDETVITYTSTAKTTSNDIALNAFNAAPFFTVGVDKDKLIPKQTFNAEITFEKAADSAFAPAAQTVAVGTVAHNGTTIQVPYVTTFADYKQRLVLVNRGGADAAYTVTFTPETGVTAAAGTAATGTLKAGKTTIISATDLVTLTGATRTAATVNIVAVSGNIDAATTTVNVSDKSTDTVKLQ